MHRTGPCPLLMFNSIATQVSGIDLLYINYTLELEMLVIVNHTGALSHVARPWI